MTGIRTHTLMTIATRNQSGVLDRSVMARHLPNTDRE